MTYIPYTPENGCKYNLIGPDGVSIASFNDPTDPNYCGLLTDVTGLDSPDVRESGDVLVGTDGGWHGNFYYGRRPITLTGSVVNVADSTARAQRLDQIRRVSNAMRLDSTLWWQPSSVGSIPMQTYVRLQQPFRTSGAWVKTFQLQLVSQWAPLFSATQYTSATASSFTVENHGSWGSFPLVTINGPTTGVVSVTNTTTGQKLQMLSSFSLGAGASVVVDILNHIVYSGSVYYNQYIDFVNTTWPALIPGTPANAGLNAFALTGAASMQMTWRDTWI